MKILVTGVAGFIGFHLAGRLLAAGREVVGLDNLNDYYDVTLKQARLQRLEKNPLFQFYRLDLADRQGMSDLFHQEAEIRQVVHLAAQAGVRGSIKTPHTYVESNLVGFLHLLEECRQHQIAHLVFASSSSVYGANTRMPYSIHAPADHPLSLYAATKKSNELMAHSYSHLFRLPCTGLRFFTVYGPWGRPDMALFKFTGKILADEPLDVFNHGRHRRDFTYIDDIVEGVVRILDQTPVPNPAWSGENPDPATSAAPYRLYNIGGQSPVELMTMIRLLEQALHKTARLNLLPLQPGDVPETCADISDLQEAVGFKPQIGIDEGIRRFVAWYLDYYTTGA